MKPESENPENFNFIKACEAESAKEADADNACVDGEGASEDRTVEEQAGELLDDTELLLAELEEAEREVEAERQADPEKAAREDRETEEQFQKLMKRIYEKGLHPVTEEAYEQERLTDEVRSRAETTKPKKPRINRKVLLLAATVCVLVVGTAMGVTATQRYKYDIYPVENERVVLEKRNTKPGSRNDNLEEAYETIQKTLDIPVLRLGHMPDGMAFNQFVIEDDCVVLAFKYNGLVIYLREYKTPEKSEISTIYMTDRKPDQIIKNEWLGIEVPIEKNNLKDGTTEYSAVIDMESSFYYFTGISGEDAFIEMVEGLYFKEKTE